MQKALQSRSDEMMILDKWVGRSPLDRDRDGIQAVRISYEMMGLLVSERSIFRVSSGFPKSSEVVGVVPDKDYRSISVLLKDASITDHHTALGQPSLIDYRTVKLEAVFSDEEFDKVFKSRSLRL